MSLLKFHETRIFCLRFLERKAHTKLLKQVLRRNTATPEDSAKLCGVSTEIPYETLELIVHENYTTHVITSWRPKMCLLVLENGVKRTTSLVY
jgi:hypothetical protein